MIMEVTRARPPMFDEIAAAFDVIGKPMLFAWGRCIYAPLNKTDVSVHLIRHEEAHGLRQMQFSYEMIAMAGESPEKLPDSDENAIRGWWRKYIDDPAFRLAEEKIGHLAEYRSLLGRASGRVERREALSRVAGKLAAPLYRYRITKDEARRFLENGIC